MTDQRTNKSVTVVFVTYKSEHLIAEAVVNVAADPAVAEIIVVDNASGDRALEIARAASPLVRTIQNTKNLGFGCGNNCGLQIATTPYSLVLNPDARFDAGGITALVETAQRHPNAAIVGPWWRTDRGQLTKVRTGPTWAREWSPYVANSERSVNFLPGAAMLLRNSAFQEIGGFFDPALFMFGEDDEICQGARDAGYELIVTTHIEVAHNSGTSCERDPRIERLRHRHMAWSQLHVQQKFRGAASAQSLARKMQRDGWVKSTFYRMLGKSEKLDKQQAMLAGVSDFLVGIRPPTELSAYEMTSTRSPETRSMSRAA